MNNEDPLFNDKRVRWAISYALNTQKLIDAEIQPIITDPSNHWWTSETKAPAFKAEDQVPQAFINLAQKRNPALSKNAITQAYYLAKSQNLLNDDGTYKAAK